MSSCRAILFVSLCSLCSLTAACSSSSSADDDADAATDDAGLSTDESAAAQSGGDSVDVNEAVNDLANELFDFDPTIDPASTAAQNATAIGQNVLANLGSACGSVNVSGASVTVAFGAPPGCTLMDGTSISGTVDLAVSQSGATTTVALMIDSVVIDGEPISGTATFSTSNGSTFSVETNLTTSSKTDVANLSVTGTAGSYTISGTSTVTQGSSTSNLVFTGLTVMKGECYADAGSISMTEGAVTEVITFDAATPTTGRVSVTIGKRTATTTLPPYGSCPSGGATKDAGTSRDAAVAP